MLYFGKIPKKMVKFGENSAKFGKIWANLRDFGKKQKKNQRFLTKILRLERGVFRLWIPKRCKGVHCVDLGESFPTSIYLQRLASIQPRTSPVKFAGNIVIFRYFELSGD